MAESQEGESQTVELAESQEEDKEIAEMAESQEGESQTVELAESQEEDKEIADVAEGQERGQSQRAEMKRGTHLCVQTDGVAG